jgi:hypothetical protein
MLTQRPYARRFGVVFEEAPFSRSGHQAWLIHFGLSFDDGNWSTRCNVKYGLQQTPHYSDVQV